MLDLGNSVIQMSNNFRNLLKNSKLDQKEGKDNQLVIYHTQENTCLGNERCTLRASWVQISFLMGGRVTRGKNK